MTPVSGLFTDLYELSMAQAYWHEGFTDEAVFSLFFRKLPRDRGYVIAAGLDDVLEGLQSWSYDREALKYLATLPGFRNKFLHWLGELRFTGDVWAVPEGTPVFPQEPLLEIRAPIAQAQLVESFVMNQIHLQSVLATKASRVVAAAAGRPVVDFAMRRMHGADAALQGARAFYIGGAAATSDVAAGQRYGIPVNGTMAHAFVQAHDRELDAFREYATLYPETTLLVDTYDTLEGVRNVIRLAEELGEDFRISAIRLDSGDLAALAHQARAMLDDAGLERVRIVASGGLDEHEIARLLEAEAPIDGFGVGTSMGVSEDAPTLDLAYKLTSYGGSGRFKSAPGKAVYPGRKQIFRFAEGGAVEDTVARHDEDHPGDPLLSLVMQGGERRTAPDSLDAIQARCSAALQQLPTAARRLRQPQPIPVRISEALQRDQAELLARLVAGSS